MKYVNVAEGDEFPIGLNLYNQCERWKGVCLRSQNWGIRVEWEPEWTMSISTPLNYRRMTRRWPRGYFRS